MTGKDQLPRPTDAELEILQVLWSTGEATVRQVYEEIAQGRPVQYSTVLKFMQIMTEKGLLLRDENQRAHLYKPARSRHWTQQQLAGHLLERAFSGSTKAFVLGALSSKKATRSELQEIRKMLDAYEKEAK
jgi:BlaI family transcriptional regulator, penicillinase repressor